MGIYRYIVFFCSVRFDAMRTFSKQTILQSAELLRQAPPLNGGNVLPSKRRLHCPAVMVWAEI
jgi:hypothetical protein